MFNCPDLSGCKKFTICFWAKIEDDANITTNWQDIIGFTEQKADNSSTGQLRAESCYSTAYVETSNSRYIHWHDNTNYAFSDFSANHTANGDTQRNVWHHCVLAMDSENGIWAYTDGNPITVSGGTVMNGGHLTGQFWLGETNNIQGVINDVRVYKDEILSPKVVKEISKGLVCHYTLSGVGGENLYTNTDEVFGNNGARLSSTTVNKGLIIDDTAPNGKYRSWDLVAENNTNRGIYYSITTSHIELNTLTENETYTVSFWVRCSKEKNMIISSIAESQTILAVDNMSKPSSDNVIILPKWMRHSVTFKWTSTSKITTCFYLRSLDENVTLDIAAPKLEKGSVATPWTPNPADPEYTKMGFDDGIEYDVSGYGHNGTKTGAITYDVDTPRYWTSSKFSSGDISTDPLPSSVITISFWYKPLSGSSYIVFADTGTGLCFGRENDHINTGISSSARADAISSSGFANNLWYHIVIVKKSDTGRDVYVNGQKVDIVGNNYWTNNIAGLFIGKRQASNLSPYYLDGNIVDFRAYVTALSADDILALYNTPISLTSNGTLLTQGELTEV